MSPDLVFVGDVHLGPGDSAVDDFVAFLGRLEPTVGRLVLMGDLFDLWIGRPELQQDHHRRVADRLAALRGAGKVVRYVEGNRDFHLTEAEAGRALDESTDGGLVERFGGNSWFAIHGDLANPHDRQYRTWRAVARSRLAWFAFNALPRGMRLDLAAYLERRLRGTNPAHRRAFPEPEVRAYAAGLLARGHDAVVLGHFHVEKDLVAFPPSPPGRILVLPEWKTSRRHLRVRTDGRASFETI